MNRGDRIQLLVKVVNKHFTPVLAPSDRTLLEHLLYACCLEDATYEAADESFHRLQESFFDWNEVRVTTITELIEHLHNLPDPKAAATRIKKNLQSVFETRYCFDLQDMIKMNQGKAVAELQKFGGMSFFVLAYVTQNALGGHAIPVSQSILQVLLKADIITEAEAAKYHVPGLDRGVPKTKGASFGSCLHQLAVLHASSPKSKQTIAIMREAGATGSEKKAAKNKDLKAEDKSPPSKPAKAVTSKQAKPPVASQNKVAKSASDKKQPPAKKKGRNSSAQIAKPKKTSAKESSASKTPQDKSNPSRRKPK